MPKEHEVPSDKTVDTYQFWIDSISLAKNDIEPYHKRGRKIVDRYRDEGARQRGQLSTCYNILYSNTETLKPILFSETPEVDVRSNDQSSYNGRAAAKMLEDSISYNAKLPETISAIKRAVEDLTLPGMGCLRVCYKPTFTEEEVEVDVYETNETKVTEKQEKVVFEEVEYKYVNWDDILFPDFKCWSDLPWLAYRGLYTYDEAKIEFKGKASKLEYNYSDKADKRKLSKDKTDKFGLAEVWEIWDKTNRRVIWISLDSKDKTPLRVDEDPLELDEFFPSPKPMFSASTNNTIIPVPMFVQYQDLADELDEVSTRIRRIVSNLKRRGCYDASIPELKNLSDASDNEFVGVKDYRQYSEKGGLKSMLDTEDVSQQVVVLRELYMARKEIIESIYQVMGYADILRGTTDPRETLGAQRIKGRFGTLRISSYQRDVQRFIRDAFRLAAQLIVNKFESKTIALQTSVPIKDVDKYKIILKQTEPSSVLVDVQTDSTIAADDMADKENIIQFTEAIAEFVNRTPAMVQVLGLQATSELLMSILKKFKIGRDIEQAVMDRVKEAAQEQEQQKQQKKKPSPEEMKMQIEQQKLQQNQMKMQAEMQIKQAELQLKNKELDIKAGEIGLKDVNEKHKIDLQAVEVALNQMKAEAEAANPNDNAFVGV